MLQFCGFVGWGEKLILLGRQIEVFERLGNSFTSLKRVQPDTDVGLLVVEFGMLVLVYKQHQAIM